MIKCSFCGISDRLQPEMIPGPNVRICRSCIEFAWEALGVTSEPGESAGGDDSTSGRGPATQGEYTGGRSAATDRRHVQQLRLKSFTAEGTEGTHHGDGAPAVVIASSEQHSDGVRLSIQRRHLPESTDLWDGNWPITDVYIRVGMFVGRVEATLRPEDFKTFRKGLETVLTARSGEAVFESLEPWLALNVRCEESGTLNVTGVVYDRLGVGNHLHFELPDMTLDDLPPLIAQLRELEAAYPSIGDR